MLKKNIFSKFFLILLILLNSNLNFASQSNLTQNIFSKSYIDLIDGVIVNGTVIHAILVSMKKIMYIKIEQDCESLSIKQLAEREKQNPNDPELVRYLCLAKKDFVEKNKDLVKKIEPVKKLIINLVKEFCEQRNRPNSVVLAWTRASNGTEAKVFNEKIQSFAEFDIFLQDLTLFLKDLVNSCPKGREQFKQKYGTKNTDYPGDDQPFFVSK